MLPRITSALTQFVAPIASGARRTTVHSASGSGAQPEFQRDPLQRKKQDGNNENSGDQPKREDERGKVVPLPTRSEAKTEEETAPPPIATELPQSVATTLIHLVSLFQQQKETLFRWLGQKSYENAAKKARSSRLFKRGTILDERIE